MTQRQAALTGSVTPEMEAVARDEGIDAEVLLANVAQGTACILANELHHNVRPVGIGKDLRTKVNANIGRSPYSTDTEEELRKLNIALESGADTVMDLSTGRPSEVTQFRKLVMERSKVPVGTVPIYQSAVEALEERGSVVSMTVDDIFRAIQAHAEDGVSFMTVHCGITMHTLERLRKRSRHFGIVSRGGAFLAAWMIHHGRENPLYEHYDRLLEIASRYDVTLSLGDALRPGCIEDSTDTAQVQELTVLGDLVARAWEAGVQVMVEGPGHVPLNEIEANVLLEKRLCHGAPFYVLGPLVTDVAPGYDHITAAIGGAIAAWAGADFLCYVTPSEHLGLPSAEEVREGVIAARIAAHAADLAKGVRRAREWDLSMSAARRALDWETQMRLALDPEKARSLRLSHNPSGVEECSMCGKYCAIKILADFMGVPPSRC